MLRVTFAVAHGSLLTPPPVTPSADSTKPSAAQPGRAFPSTLRIAMQAFESNETESQTATMKHAVEAMARLRALVLSKESEPLRCVYPRARLESSMATHGEAVFRQPAQRPTCRREYNKAVGISLHDSATTSPTCTLRAGGASVVPDRNSSVRGEDYLVERRLQHASARYRGRQEGRKLTESAY